MNRPQTSGRKKTPKPFLDNSIPAKFEMDPVRSDASYSPQKEVDREYGGIALIAMSVEYDAYKPEERVYVPRTGIENATSTAVPSPAPQAVSKVQAPAPRPVNIPQTETAEPEGWVCSCGKHHQFYVSACSCGKTKKEAKLEAHSQQN